MKWLKGTFEQEGKGKFLYTVKDKPSLVWMEFKDDLTAFNGKKKSFFKGKGALNRDVSSLIFRFLEQKGIQTHWVGDVHLNGMVCEKLNMLDLEVVLRNRLAGGTAKRFRIPEGRGLAKPLVELYYKDDALGDPFMSNQQALALGFVNTAQELKSLTQQALLVNQQLKTLFDSINLELIDFKLEFGKSTKNKALWVLGDEFSCDTCRLWDKKTGERQDKDRFRLNLGGVEQAYQRVHKALALKLSSFL